jgi:hypothetical protein
MPASRKINAIEELKFDGVRQLRATTCQSPIATQQVVSQGIECVFSCGEESMTDSGLFFPPLEILEAISVQIEPAAGTAGMLIAASELLNNPFLVNPPFCLRDQP